MMNSCLSVLAVAAVGSAVSVTPSPYTNGWKVAAHAKSSNAFEFRVAVKQQGIAEIKKIALEVSDPKNPKYTQFLSQAEIDRLTQPTTTDITTVTSWITNAGCKHTASNTNVLTVSCTISTAETLLNTRIHTLVNQETNQTVERAVQEYTIPDEVAPAVSAIFGVHGLPLPPSANMAITSSLPGEPAKVTPAVLSSTYQIPNATGVTAESGIAQAVAEFQGQYYSPSHLTSFYNKYIPGAPSSDAKVRNVVGKNSPDAPGTEAELDIQYIMGVAPTIPTDFYSQAAMDFCKDLIAWTQLLQSGDDVPYVHSISYGFQGDLDQLQCKSTETGEIDDAFAKLAAKGISIIFASGDSGSGYTGGLFGGKLYPSWPASSPWVTAVGATRFQDQDVSQPQMATDQFGSGGGFSKMFDRTDAQWQDSAVKNYLSVASDLPPSNAFPASGRATPDVSALGEGYQVLTGMGPAVHPESVGGTSASTPAFSGMVSLLNDARIKAGKKQLGFLNPFIYQNVDAFTDITMGTNAINRGGEKVKWGFETAKGWDPATGVGVPIYPALLKAAMAAP